MKQCKMLSTMKKIRGQIANISGNCSRVYENTQYWLNWPNECARTDRVIENVINEANEIVEMAEVLKRIIAEAKAKYEGQFGEQSPRIP